jgi:hypothetical protein
MINPRMKALGGRLDTLDVLCAEFDSPGIAQTWRPKAKAVGDSLVEVMRWMESRGPKPIPAAASAAFAAVLGPVLSAKVRVVSLDDGRMLAEASHPLFRAEALRLSRRMLDAMDKASPGTVKSIDIQMSMGRAGK